MDNEKAFDTYKLAKTNVQLIEASLENLHIDKYDIITITNPTYEISFGKRIEFVTDSEIFSFLKTTINCYDEITNEQFAKIDVVYKGRFVSNNPESKSQLETWTDIQTVPQLLPYTRSLVSAITAQMSMSPIILPTLDILESIIINEEL